MVEKNSAGLKELIYSILWVLVILIGYDLIDTLFRTVVNSSTYTGQNMFLTILAVGCGCVLAYFVLTRYAATFIYEIDDKKIHITRKIGHREKTIDIKNKAIRSFSKGKPQNETKVNHKMKKTVFSNRKTYYLTYISGNTCETVVFEPSAKMAMEISKRVKEG